MQRDNDLIYVIKEFMKNTFEFGKIFENVQESNTFKQKYAIWIGLGEIKFYLR